MQSYIQMRNHGQGIQGGPSYFPSKSSKVLTFPVDLGLQLPPPTWGVEAKGNQVAVVFAVFVYLRLFVSRCRWVFFPGGGRRRGCKLQ